MRREQVSDRLREAAYLMLFALVLPVMAAIILIGVPVQLMLDAWTMLRRPRPDRPGSAS